MNAESEEEQIRNTAPQSKSFDHRSGAIGDLVDPSSTYSIELFGKESSYSALFTF